MENKSPKKQDVSPQPTPKARGARLTLARELAGLKRKAFAEKYNFNPFTYKGWENGKHGGLTEKRARTIICILENEGVNCDFEWLMYGTGKTPQITKYDTNKIPNKLQIMEPPPTEPFSQFDEERQIAREMQFFQQGNPNPVNLTVNDNGMKPNYQIGDVVAGSKYYGKEIKKACGYICIVQTNNEETLLRTVHKGQDKNKYTLLCLNSNANEKMLRQDVELISAAPVLWHRRKTKKFKA
jgi:hypothetical protein